MDDLEFKIEDAHPEGSLSVFSPAGGSERDLVLNATHA